MKVPDYLVGLLEAFGFLALFQAGHRSLLCLVIVLAVKAVYVDKLWVIPSNLFTVQNVRIS
jgi:hypothetical protein